MRTSLRRFIRATVLLLSVVGFAWSQSPPDLDSKLLDLSSSDLGTRARAFYDLIGTFGDSAASADVGVKRLLDANPAQAERIKTELIAHLERESSYIEGVHSRNESVGENVGVYHSIVSLAVASLRDRRAIKGLLAVDGPSGRAWSFFNDLCPDAIDAIVEHSHKPPQYRRGILARDNRGEALALLGRCLTRGSAMRAVPEAFAKARRELLAALNDPEPNTRRVASDSLMALHYDSEVRAKLGLLAATDPYVAPAANGPPASQPSSRFRVRDSAKWVLDGPGEDWFYLVRNADTRACRLLPAAEAQPETAFIGPIEGREGAEEELCLHHDSAAKDPSLCWTVSPQNACRERR